MTALTGGHQAIEAVEHLAHDRAAFAHGLALHSTGHGADQGQRIRSITAPPLQRRQVARSGRSAKLAEGLPVKGCAQQGPGCGAALRGGTASSPVYSSRNVTPSGVTSRDEYQDGLRRGTASDQ